MEHIERLNADRIIFVDNNKEALKKAKKKNPNIETLCFDVWGKWHIKNRILFRSIF